MHNLLLVIFPAAASAIAAWWGGKLGVRREAEKLVQARAFDRRLEWYERSIRALSGFTWVLKEFVRTVVESEPREASYAEISKVFPEMMLILAECEIYGRPTTYLALIKLVTELRLLMGPDSPLDKAGVIATSAAIEREIAQAKAALVREGRNHLGLEALPEGQKTGRKIT